MANLNNFDPFMKLKLIQKARTMIPTVVNFVNLNPDYAKELSLALVHLTGITGDSVHLLTLIGLLSADGILSPQHADKNNFFTEDLLRELSLYPCIWVNVKPEKNDGLS